MNGLLWRIGLRLQLVLDVFRKHVSCEQLKILFVVGTGRSGTHLVTQCLSGHRQIVDLAGGKENPLIFGLVTQAALDYSHATPLLDKAQNWYDALARLAAPNWLVDQSHPNIWFADSWAKIYPQAHFVAIIRNPFSVVASMMRHQGVRAWAEQWEKFPVPNALLGITEENRSTYADMTLVERCTLRWIAHYKRLEELRGLLAGRLSIIVYEELCLDPSTVLAGIARALDIDNNFTLPKIETAPLMKAANMPPGEVRSIERMLNEAEIPARWCSPYGSEPPR
jgi:hypothetical protein